MGRQILAVAAFGFSFAYGLVVALPRPSEAATYYWALPEGEWGDWSVPGNWGGTEPTANDTVYIQNWGTANVTQPGAACKNIYFQPGTINQTGGSLSADWMLGSMTYTISAGSLSGSLAYYAGALTQSGGNVTLDQINVGESGSGSYSMTGGTLNTWKFTWVPPPAGRER